MSETFIRNPIVNCIGQTQDQIDNANHVITIIWGTCQDKTETYAFDTEEDQEMFLLGVDAACGYLDYEIENDAQETVGELEMLKRNINNSGQSDAAKKKMRDRIAQLQAGESDDE